jgi:hypothetical protein
MFYRLGISVLNLNKWIMDTLPNAELEEQRDLPEQRWTSEYRKGEE